MIILHHPFVPLAAPHLTLLPAFAGNDLRGFPDPNHLPLCWCSHGQLLQRNDGLHNHDTELQICATLPQQARQKTPPHPLAHMMCTCSIYLVQDSSGNRFAKERCVSLEMSCLPNSIGCFADVSLVHFLSCLLQVSMDSCTLAANVSNLTANLLGRICCLIHQHRHEEKPPQKDQLKTCGTCGLKQIKAC
eukprot:TRINITY_DN30456_c0_g1_i1.p1 TRINITY_DN30456_c0_g1~~TRINITY_DN30456_c0_g1_i1.p1  ORF type:complete len:190 (-),score=18.76 TRINITY_DN30456_c0_g1_i1:141-710(-)